MRPGFLLASSASFLLPLVHACCNATGAPSSKTAQLRNQTIKILYSFTFNTPDSSPRALSPAYASTCSQGASASATVPWLQQCAVPIPSAAPPTSAVTNRLAADAIGAGLEPLALAAAAGHARCVALLLRRGARVDVHVVRHIVWSLNAAGLEALVSLRVQPLPPSHPCSFAEGPMHCPILLLLLRHLEAVTATKRASERRRGGGGVGGGTSLMRRLGQQAVQMMDLLYVAGYRLQVYTGALCCAMLSGVDPICSCGIITRRCRCNMARCPPCSPWEWWRQQHSCSFRPCRLWPQSAASVFPPCNPLQTLVARAQTVCGA